MRLPPIRTLRDVDAWRRELERADRENQKRRQDVELGVASVVLTSPDGSRWRLTVDDSGTLGATAL